MITWLFFKCWAHCVDWFIDEMIEAINPKNCVKLTAVYVIVGNKLKSSKAQMYQTVLIEKNKLKNYYINMLKIINIFFMLLLKKFVFTILELD